MSSNDSDKKVDYDSSHALDAAWCHFRNHTGKGFYDVYYNISVNSTMFMDNEFYLKYSAVDRRYGTAISFERMLKMHGVEVYELKTGKKVVTRYMKYGDDFDMALFLLKNT
jgi:hypothetical protein